MERTTVIEGQTIWDITLQQYGSVEGIFELLDANTQLDSINANILPGMQLVTSGEKLDTDVAGYYQNNHVIVVSGSHIGSTGNPFTDDFNCDFDGGTTCDDDAFNTDFSTAFN